MAKGFPDRNPSGKYRRKVIAERRIGATRQCACGETRPQALIREQKRVVCHECKRKENGMKLWDDHHVAGKANSPITIPIRVNDHRAVLSPCQTDWPKDTLENRSGSPLRAAAACVRGCIDTILYLSEQGLLWIAEMLEVLDVYLTKKLGSKYWENTELERFKPKR